MAAELRKIQLYGKLGALFGRVHYFAVRNAAGAIQALSANFPGFRPYMQTAHLRGIQFAVCIGKENISENQLHDPVGSRPIRIAPILMAAKAGVLQTIIGIVLIVVGVIIRSPQLVEFGATVLLGGIVQLLTPVPKTSTSAGNTPSYSFNGPLNTQAQGRCVPLGYGQMIVGSDVISGSITAKHGIYVPTAGAASGTPGAGGAGSGGGGGSSPIGGGSIRSFAPV